MVPARSPASARAKALAHIPPTQAARGDFLEVIEFVLADEHHALETRRVREVVPLKDFTPLPCTPPFIRGIINVRGQILTVIDLKRFFELPETGIADLHRVIILSADGMELGLVTDAVLQVRAIPADRIQASLPTLTGWRAAYLKGVTDERLAILDADRILADPRLIVEEEVESPAWPGLRKENQPS